MIELFTHGVRIPVTLSKFPGGESLVRIEKQSWAPKTTVWIYCHFESNDDLFNLALLVDAVRRQYADSDYTVTLEMPYLPYARQDRVCNPGESLSVRVVCDFINSLKFDEVWVNDLHSDVPAALLNNLHHRDLVACARWAVDGRDRDSTVLVSPDAGANKKVQRLAKEFGFKEVVRADKLRDLKTGTIKETVVYSSHVGHKDFLIVDDICDGGRTFIELAKKLRGLTHGEVWLYVTHGIFSAGVGVFEGIVDRIYVNNPMTKETHPLLIKV